MQWHVLTVLTQPKVKRLYNQSGRVLHNQHFYNIQSPVNNKYLNIQKTEKKWLCRYFVFIQNTSSGQLTDWPWPLQEIRYKPDVRRYYVNKYLINNY